MDTLFAAAAELPAAERSGFLEQACGGDEALRREVESLLEYDARSGEPIEGILQEAAQSLLERRPRIGEHCGPYRLTSEIGSGGMATVYLGVRDDDQYRKQVAVKLIRSEVPGAPLLERFRRERQILAGLDHPYIARLLDGGTTQDGAPYFVMEYVEGVPIDIYCEERKLGIEERCELFRRVCEAVGYAHRNLVVHRDIKPGNLLVTADGTPKLLDFGIARLMTPDGAATVYGREGLQHAMTPDYASPEQVRGGAVTTASDIYSLGALLYRLLTEARPHVLRTYTPLEVEQVVCREEPARPSVAAANPTWGRRLRGDLDNIILMAMRKEPDRRYDSAQRLADDIGRHLEGLPVWAREDTLGYRAGKFLRRHRWAVAAGFAAGMSLAAAAGYALWQGREADAARQRAEAALKVAERSGEEARTERNNALRESARATAASGRARREAVAAEQARGVAEQRLAGLVELANRSVFDIQGAIEKLSGATEARQQIAKTTAEYLDRLARETQGDQRVQRVLAQAYLRLGDVQGHPTKASLGQTAAAEQSYRKAETLLAELLRSMPRERDLRVRHSEVQFRLGLVLGRGSRSEEGLRWLESGVAEARALTRENPTDAMAVEHQAALEQALARALTQTNLTRADEFAKAQLATYQRLVVLRQGDDASEHGLSSAYTLHGSLVAQLGRVEEALEDARRSAEIRERLVARHPNDVELQRDLMLVYGHIGDRLGSPLIPNLGDPAAARLSYDKALRIVESMVAADPSNRTAKRDLLAVSLRLGLVTVRPEERSESLQVLRRATSLAEELLRADPKNMALQSDLGTSHEYQGTRRMEAGEYAAALEEFRASLAIAERMAAADPKYASARHQIMASRKGLCSVLALQGERAAVLAELEKSQKLGEELAEKGPNPRAMQRYRAVVPSWYGFAYETLARLPGGSLEDWRMARDAYAKSLKQWEGVEQAFRDWARREIADVQRRLAECARQAGPA